MMKKIIIAALLLTGYGIAVEVGKVPPKVVLSGKEGAKVDGSAWRSDTLKGKVHILFYVDPDERKKNDVLSQALKKRHFDRNKFASVAVINLAATWMPNMVLESLLKKKQKQFPDTVYVKDRQKVLVKKWQLADDNSDIIIFDKAGRVIYKKFGKLSKAEITKVLELIEKHL